MGIMHRDVKSGNIMVDPEKKTLKLIDWGLAEYYYPHKMYNPKVSTIKYKGPELLIGLRYYSYSLDMWATGLTFAQMIFKRKFFHGAHTDEDQL